MENPLLKECSLEHTGYLLLSFCFEAQAYCVPLLQHPTGANLFRLNSTVVSSMFFEKRGVGLGGLISSKDRQ